MKNSEKISTTFVLIALAIAAVSCAGTEIKNDTAVNPAESIQKNITEKFSNTDAVISLRIDNVTFDIYQKEFLKKALELARKYNIRFSLAVSADLFEQYRDLETLRLYEENKDVFEIVAEGLDRKNPEHPQDPGEFYDIRVRKPIPPDTQALHIKRMKEIFTRRNMQKATEVFIVPWARGDEFTIKLAAENGYKLIMQNDFPKGMTGNNYNNSIIVSKSYVYTPWKEILDDTDKKNIKDGIDKFFGEGQTKVQVVFRHVNFNPNSNFEAVLKYMLYEYPQSKVKYDWISNTY